LMRQKAEALRVGDYDKFLKVEGNGSADGWVYGQYGPEFNQFDELRKRKYFAEDEPQRLDRIRANLDNLVIAEPANILDVAQTETGFSKIYLSNVLGFGNDGSEMRVTEILENIARNLPMNGLVYVANHGGLIRKRILLFEDKEDIKKDLYSILDKDKDLRDSSFLPPELEVDKDLSRKVRGYEGGIWKPAVYRRVEPKTPFTF